MNLSQSIQHVQGGEEEGMVENDLLSRQRRLNYYNNGDWTNGGGELTKLVGGDGCS